MDIVSLAFAALLSAIQGGASGAAQAVAGDKLKGSQLAEFLKKDPDRYGDLLDRISSGKGDGGKEAFKVLYTRHKPLQETVDQLFGQGVAVGNTETNVDLNVEQTNTPRPQHQKGRDGLIQASGKSKVHVGDTKVSKRRPTTGTVALMVASLALVMSTISGVMLVTLRSSVNNQNNTIGEIHQDVTVIAGQVSDMSSGVADASQRVSRVESQVAGQTKSDPPVQPTPTSPAPTMSEAPPGEQAQYLGDMGIITYHGDRPDTRVIGHLSGGLYNDSVRFGSTRGFMGNSPLYAEWDLGTKCSTLEMTVGIEDESMDADFSGSVLVAGDGTTLWKNDKTVLGYPVPARVNVSGVLRLRITVQHTAGGSYGAFLLGSATVTCSQ